MITEKELDDTVIKLIKKIHKLEKENAKLKEKIRKDSWSN